MATVNIRSPQQIWSFPQRVVTWLHLWVSILQYQQMAGVAEIEDSDIEAYRSILVRFMNDMDYQRSWLIWLRESCQQTRHEVVAAMQVFNRAAGGRDLIHQGLTSCDVTEVTTQLQLGASIDVLLQQATSIADGMWDRVQHESWRDVYTTGRTHGQPAQAISYAHRWATILGPLVDWIERVRDTGGNLMRPLMGAVGTGADLRRLVGSAEAVALSRRVLGEYKFSELMVTTRQTYHRSYDEHLVSLVSQLASIGGTFATDRRLEAMLQLGWERTAPEQVGSSAMPHKRNPRYSERLSSMVPVVRAQAGAIAALGGNEWLEGDVAGSAGRKLSFVALFNAAEILVCNWMYVVRHWEINPLRMAAELRSHRDEVATGAVMAWLVSEGWGRSDAHKRVAQLSRQEMGLRAALEQADDIPKPVPPQIWLEAVVPPDGGYWARLASCLKTATAGIDRMPDDWPGDLL